MAIDREHVDPSGLTAIDCVPWLDAGGVYAIANVRGGGQFGKTWHRRGMREQKENVFDDFIAADISVRAVLPTRRK